MTISGRGTVVTGRVERGIVKINEAIEIARSLASAESARFANGVLDRVRKEIGRDSHNAS
jgi:translation elongation factor EF-Tu-like GTPase